MPCHPSHVTRFSFDRDRRASTWNEMCVNCGHTDMVPGGWAKLAKPCPVAEAERLTLEEYNERRRQFFAAITEGRKEDKA